MICEFGPFLLDSEERQLQRGGETIPLTAKAFDVLLLLVRNPGRTVTKEEFMSEVWAGTVVEEANLTDNISTLRQALGDDAREPTYIRTVPRRGYRFAAEVREPTPRQQEAAAEGHGTAAAPGRGTEAAPGHGAAAAPGRRWLVPAAILIAAVILATVAYRYPPWATPEPKDAVSETHSLAVLPFKPLSSAERDPAMEMGMTDALIAKLSRIRELSVRPTMAVMAYADKPVDIRTVGSALDVDTVLDGKLQKSGERMRVSVQLVRVADGATIWADRFDERFTDIFALQDAISERVANALQVRLTAAQRQSLSERYTNNTEAYQLYLNGIHQWRTFTQEGLLASVNYHNAAIKLDPNFAPAWAGLGKAYNVIGIYGPLSANEAFPKSIAAANKAIALAPNLAEARIPLVAAKLLYERDWDGAARQLDIIQQLDPSCGDQHTLRGYYYQAMGRTTDALIELQRASEAAPDFQIATNDALLALNDARRFDDAIAEARKSIALNPNTSVTHYALGEALAGKGDYQAAIEPLERAIATAHKTAGRGQALLAWVYGRMGQREKALSLIEKIKAQDTPWKSMFLAEAYAGMGENDEVFAWLNRACDENFGFVWDVRNRHVFDGLRNDPRYAQVLARIKLEP
jgi:TolB-like protein/DNA-binding winged helix-turn-helix (wHTH) protein/lipopolysaccharide biosynthesis regulator YciM